jgi:hypothetical protein
LAVSFHYSDCSGFGRVNISLFDASLLTSRAVFTALFLCLWLGHCIALILKLFLGRCEGGDEYWAICA